MPNNRDNTYPYKDKSFDELVEEFKPVAHTIRTFCEALQKNGFTMDDIVEHLHEEWKMTRYEVKDMLIMCGVKETK